MGRFVGFASPAGVRGPRMSLQIQLAALGETAGSDRGFLQSLLEAAKDAEVQQALQDAALTAFKTHVTLGL